MTHEVASRDCSGMQIPKRARRGESEGEKKRVGEGEHEGPVELAAAHSARRGGLCVDLADQHGMGVERLAAVRRRNVACPHPMQPHWICIGHVGTPRTLIMKQTTAEHRRRGPTTSRDA